MSSPLSGVLNKARTSLGGPLGGFQGPQKMQMPNRMPGGIMPPGAGGGMPAFGGGMPGGMVPQGPISMPDSGMPIGGMPQMPPMGAPPGNTGIIPPHMRSTGPMGGPIGGPPGNTGIIPPHMRNAGPMGGAMDGSMWPGRRLATFLRKRRVGAGQRFGQVATVPMGNMPSMPSMPSAPPGAALA